MYGFHVTGLEEGLLDAAEAFVKGRSGLENLETEAVCKPGGLHVRLCNDKAWISFSRRVELFRGIGFLEQWKKEGRAEAEEREQPVFQHLTYMADCSRNAVCKVEYLQMLIKMLARMGYDRLMLYTEDTFQVEGSPFFGYMRGKYSRKELLGLDAYAAQFGIELVPCIQTLAHLNALFRWEQFGKVRDTGDILCCGLEETYELIESMVKTFADTCRSRVINIGMDEAEMIGRGRFLKEFGYQERMDIMEAHLKRVVEICRGYGYTCMMWSDMFFKMLTGDKYFDETLVISEDMKKRIPQGLELVYWDYYARNPQKYDVMLRQHKQMTDRIGFAGGAWKWNGFAPLLHHSMEASGYALENCRKHGIQNILVTAWGDNGGEAAQSVVFPVLALFAEYQYTGRIEKMWLRERFAACTGGNLDAFLSLDCLNLTPDNPSPGRVSVGPAKYLLYQDILLGIYDRHVDAETYPQHFKDCAEKLQAGVKKAGEFGYVFETLAALGRVLALKSDLGIRLKKAYDQKDKEALDMICTDCEKLEQLVSVFHEALREQWNKENKPFGLEVQDIRLGGLKERIRRCRERVAEYQKGETERIEELEEERLLLDERENPGYATLPLWDNEWNKMVTAGIL